MNTGKIQRNTLQNSAQFDMCTVTSFSVILPSSVYRDHGKWFMQNHK